MSLCLLTWLIRERATATNNSTINKKAEIKGWRDAAAMREGESHCHQQHNNQQKIGEKGAERRRCQERGRKPFSPTTQQSTKMGEKGVERCHCEERGEERATAANATTINDERERMEVRGRAREREPPLLLPPLLQPSPATRERERCCYNCQPHQERGREMPTPTQQSTI